MITPQGFFFFIFFSAFWNRFELCALWLACCHFHLNVLLGLLLTDMEFGEQLTAPALRMASSSTSSSSAPPKAASTERASQEPGAAGGSSLSTCGTWTHNVTCAPLWKTFGHKVECGAKRFWCVIYLLFIMNKMVQSFQLGWGLSVLAGPSAVTVSTVLNTQIH